MSRNIEMTRWDAQEMFIDDVLAKGEARYYIRKEIRHLGDDDLIEMMNDAGLKIDKILEE